MEQTILLFAGLGLFFAGIKELGRNFKSISGPRMRRMLAGATGQRWSSALTGLTLGIVTQSSNASVFLAVSLVTASLLPLAGALPAVVWANVGTSVLVILATLDMHIVVGLLISLVGLCYYFGLHDHDRFRHIISIMLSIGLLLMGLIIIKHGASALQQVDWVQTFLSRSGQHLILSILAGALLAMIAQSSAAVSVIAVTMLGSGLLTFHQAAMLVFGSSLGSAASVCMMGSSLRGDGMVLVFAQAAVKVIGVILLLPVILIELKIGVPGIIMDALARIVSEPAHQVAVLYVMLQVVPALLITPLTSPMLRWMKRITPADPVEELSRPVYLFDRAVDTPGVALDLVDREQARIASRLAGLLDSLRVEEVGAVEWTTVTLARSSQQLMDRIGQFLDAIMPRCEQHDTLERMVAARTRLDLLRMLVTHTWEINESLAMDFADPALQKWRHHLIEGLHSIMCVLGDSVNGSPELREVLVSLTSDRSDLMSRMRAQLLQGSDTINLETRERVLTATRLFERIVWLMNRFGRS